MPETTDPAPKRLLSEPEARAYLGGLSARSMYDFRIRWRVPAIKILPQSLRFDPADLDRAIADARAASIAEEQAKAAARIAAGPTN